ncbi:hypothetical protein EWM64_g10949 [Hericium alpestre]|uniref:Uncharacterized protein n=1 Tax=Hericium alpestre TaxID=135208 RepID=A0A4Y9ZGW0_9AGAM|nr:hypothetical protein EWM64_g10949 [Hericium alpestre]
MLQLPHNLANTGPMQRILDKLLDNWAIQHVAGFGSSIFALYAPKVYAYYVENFEKLCHQFPSLKWPFQNSIFPTSTFNLGPATICHDHIDCTNVPHGWCVITPFGHFDHKKEGQLVLWGFGLIINLPLGSSTEIPSSSIRHANTAIAEGETCFSFTQYCPGGLLQYMCHGFRPVGMLSYQEQVEMDGLPEERW